MKTAILTLAILALAAALLGAADVEAPYSTYLPLLRSADGSQALQRPPVPTPPADCGYPDPSVHVWTCVDGTPTPADIP